MLVGKKGFNNSVEFDKREEKAEGGEKRGGGGGGDSAGDGNGGSGGGDEGGRQPVGDRCQLNSQQCPQSNFSPGCPVNFAKRELKFALMTFAKPPPSPHPFAFSFVPRFRDDFYSLFSKSKGKG
ncbi:hypothetical protein M0804_007220 [Polistes exclamans]|nr:hypothetical protein M0804_007220 [Polistes exclamans]